MSDRESTFLFTVDEAERQVLGVMMRDREAIAVVRLLIGPRQFRTDFGQKVCAAIFALHEAGEPAELVAVAEKLFRHGHIDAAKDAGDYERLAAIWQDTTLSSHSSAHYANCIHDHWLRREMRVAAGQLANIAEHPTGLAEEMIAETVQKLIALTHTGVGDDLKSLPEIMNEATDAIDRRSAVGAKNQHLVSTGFSNLDSQLGGGLSRQELTILAARTSVGKTAMALAIARRVIARGLIVFFASLEQSRLDIAFRMLSAEARIDFTTVHKGRIESGGTDAEAVMNAARTYREQQMFVTDTRNQTSFQIALKAAKIKATKGLDLVVVDYTQLLKAEDRTVKRYEQLGIICQGFRKMAHELDVPVMALAQLNRGSEDRQRPQLSDIRESGNIEQDSDVVILLSKGMSGDETFVNVDVAKNRNGATGTVSLKFFPSYLDFQEPTLSERQFLEQPKQESSYADRTYMRRD